MDPTRVNEWNQSYARAENHVFYPHEAVVKFVNRHIRKRLGVARFRDILPPRSGQVLRALDFGCGIGADVIMMREFGIDARGVDISSVSIDIARQHARSRGMNIDECFGVIEPNSRLPFEDGWFDIFIASGVLDSMPVAAARWNMLELSRVTTQCGYLSLVAGEGGEQVVQTDLERDTIQSYFTYERCLELLAGTGFEIRFCELVTSQERGGDSPANARYHITLARR